MLQEPVVGQSDEQGRLARACVSQQNLFLNLVKVRASESRGTTVTFEVHASKFGEKIG